MLRTLTAVRECRAFVWEKHKLLPVAAWHTYGYAENTLTPRTIATLGSSAPLPFHELYGVRWAKGIGGLHIVTVALGTIPSPSECAANTVCSKHSWNGRGVPE
jgi:hypothetical protein